MKWRRLKSKAPIFEEDLRNRGQCSASRFQKVRGQTKLSTLCEIVSPLDLIFRKILVFEGTEEQRRKIVGQGKRRKQRTKRKKIFEEGKYLEQKNGKENIWRRKIYYLQRRKRVGGFVIGLSRNSFFVSFPTNGLPPLVPRVIILALHCRVCKLSRLHCVPDFCALLSLKDKASPFEKILLTNYHRSLLAQSRIKKEDCPPNQT